MDVLQSAAIMVGVISGIIGCVLGVLNNIHQRDTTKPRLRVRPLVTLIVGCSREYGSKMSDEIVGVMEVCNVGNVPVMGGTIGFMPKRKSGKGRLVLSPSRLGEGKWPCEIRPGHMVMLQFNRDDLVDPIERGDLGRAFVSSIVDDTFTASRRDMKAFQRQLLATTAELKDHPSS